MFHLLLDSSTSAIDVSSLLTYLSKASASVFLIIGVYGGYKKWWVFGWVYRDLDERLKKMTEEKNAWRDTALESAKIATKAFQEAERRS